MFGQLWELPCRAPEPGAVPGRGAAEWPLVVVVAGDEVVEEALLDDVAAVAIAAPPPARAAITTIVIRPLRITAASFGLVRAADDAPRTSEPRRRGRRVTWEVIDARLPGWNRARHEHANH